MPTASGSHEDMERRLPIWALIGLGATQIVGYGTLYYAFRYPRPDIAKNVGISEKWVRRFSLIDVCDQMLPMKVPPVIGSLRRRRVPFDCLRLRLAISLSEQRLRGSP